MGDSHHAATRADRKSPPRRGPDCDWCDRAEQRRCVGRPDDGRRRARSQEPDPRDCGHGALEPADGELVCRRAGAPVAGSKRRVGVAAHVDRAATFRGGIFDRTAGAIGDAGTGWRSSLDQQHHRQSALSGVDGLARVRRNDEYRRAEVARRSGRALRQDGFCDARSLPARRGGDREEQLPVRKRCGAQGDPAVIRGHHRHRWQERRRRSGRARRLLSGRQGAAASRTSGADAYFRLRGSVQVRAADPFAAVPRWHRADHGDPHRDPVGEGTSRRRCRRRARDARSPRAAGRKPTGGGDRELAGDIARDAARIAANGLFQGAANAGAHAGGGPDDAQRRRKHRRPDRGAGGPVPRQSGRQSEVRPADRFSGRAHRNAAGGRAAVAAYAEGDR